MKMSGVLLGLLTLYVPLTALAGKVPLAELCVVLAGEWQGTAANPTLAPMAVSTSVMCSADKRNIYISVSRGSRFSNSETWWFRQQQDKVLLVYGNGVTEDITQQLTLYQQAGSFSFLGEGEINQRPALVQLQFDPIKASIEQPVAGWQWLQSAHYLDDDSEQYQVVRALSLLKP
ncbi:hypothetical protein [Shewanella ulleungensis]|uniref:DUF1579 domain-containing protein n=1 Tax=Shewanella ulleungensis TaxID=2282699 RepID=A0ABQ2QTN9_9GAMM|nr:hypothetical protein [Shewanella ulleungensis]MCL1150780.1 hypothetical protein [Shewanella ulleungensis]GGP93585.1 hypothetical protein GCM10009410_29580 [Shewanella ulleungensis]